MLSRVSDNPKVCQITNIRILSNILNHEPLSNVRCSHGRNLQSLLYPTTQVPEKCDKSRLKT
jgi:hypothetical protein